MNRKKTTIQLDPELYKFGREYARKEQISFSDLINRYLLQLTRTSKNNLSENSYNIWQEMQKAKKKNLERLKKI